jgi:hypothetical protein
MYLTLLIVLCFIIGIISLVGLCLSVFINLFNNEM